MENDKEFKINLSLLIQDLRLIQGKCNAENLVLTGTSRFCNMSQQCNMLCRNFM